MATFGSESASVPVYMSSSKTLSTTRPARVTISSASSLVMLSGGARRKWSPFHPSAQPVAENRHRSWPFSSPLRRSRLAMFSFRGKGSFVALFATNSTHQNRPRPTQTINNSFYKILECMGIDLPLTSPTFG